MHDGHQIRDVPYNVRDALARQAAANGQSLQAYLLTLVTERAHTSRNAVLLRRLSGRSDGARTEPGETAVDVAQERERA